MDNHLTFDAFLPRSALAQGTGGSSSDHYCFQPAANLNNGNCSQSLKSSGSVDDFLAGYTLEDVSILDFMSCLGEIEIDPVEKYSCSISENGIVENIAPSVACKRTLSSNLSTHSELTSKKRLQTRLALSSAQTASFKTKASTEKSCAEGKTDLDSREENRRSKNREYQRRFREKKMRLELQRLFSQK